jgi:2-polyprenyl-3-methyl-5-hydroxy-6-metoxy-1,4-benzoquinol methylase
VGWQERYLARYYQSRPGWINGTEEFHNLCARTIPHGGKILEIGAGPPNRTSQFLATHGELHGIDPDPTVKENSALRTSEVLAGDTYPYASESFHACVSNYVVEHVADPAAHMREVARVLRPGGTYVFRTPNRFHYVAAVSSLTPHWFHHAVAHRIRRQSPETHEVYPTFYAMNSRSAVNTLAPKAGLQVELLQMVEKEPSYGMASRALFLAFMGYERLVNATELAADLRANIFAVLRKPDHGPAR